MDVFTMSSYAPLGGRWSISFSLLCFSWGCSVSLEAGECPQAAARAISIQGRVESITPEASSWKAVEQGDSFCPGDRLRVGANSRAGLTLRDESLMRLAENSSARFSASTGERGIWVDLLQGIAHFISRVTHPFQVDTPHVNAYIEGTEFTVESGAKRAKITVLEGQVRARNAKGEVVVNGGQRAESLKDQAPRTGAVVDPLDAVQWALYYPPVAEPPESHPSEAVGRSLAAYRRGDLNSAFAALAQESGVSGDAGLRVYRASLHLRVGGIEAARRDLRAALRLGPERADALALMSIIATVRNEPLTALELAQRGVRTDARAVSAHLALSYAYQAQFRLPEALESARRATRVAPGSPLAWSRLAQLELMFRHLTASREAARRAVELAPDQPWNQTTLGFARLIRLDLDGARQAFEQAISFDQAAPLPRLGLGLVRIREGDLAGGRRQLETAANLDPGNALIRSYLGKAYYEEKRDSRAGTQFALAKQFDELDPTAWFYDAVRKQSENHPLEALDDLQGAIARNDNRAVYRSRLLLDEDQAARGASLARIYDDLGFERLAFKESWKSLAADPGNASAHRFLSDSYAGIPRHEIARVSERLRAQMLSQEIVSPVSPGASEARLLAFQGSGPSVAGFNEYNPMFNRRRLAFLASGVSGSNNTRGEEIAVGGFANRGMLSAGYYHESSDGFRENNDSDQTIGNLFGQFRITPELSVQMEVRHRRGEYGDLAQLFEQDYLLSRFVRRETESDSRRIGLNFTPRQNHIFLLSAIGQELKDKEFLPFNHGMIKDEGSQYEIQYIFKGGNNIVTSGVGRVNLQKTQTHSLSFIGLPMPIVDSSTTRLYQKTAYLYLNTSWPWGKSILGCDYANLDDDHLISEKRFNPKLGLIWNPTDSTVVRMTGFRTLRLHIIDNQSIAPTEIAGFNQIYDDFLGTEAKRYAFGLDHHFAGKIDAGLEFSKRFIARLSDDLTALDDEQHESSRKAYLYWPAGSNFSLGGSYAHERFERDFVDGMKDPYRPATLNTKTLKLHGNLFHESGLFAELSASHIAQDVESILTPTGTREESDRFWIGDAAVGYRFPKRSGLVKLQIKNLFDKEFRYQSTFFGTSTPKSSPYYPDRSFYLYVQFWL